jgi:hypothetical protein
MRRRLRRSERMNMLAKKRDRDRDKRQTGKAAYLSLCQLGVGDPRERYYHIHEQEGSKCASVVSTQASSK